MALSLALSDKIGLPAEAKAGSRLLAYRMSGGTATLISDDIELLSVPEQQSQLGTQSVTLAVAPSQVADVLAAGAQGDLRLAVPASDVSATGTVLTTAPSSVPTTAEEGNHS